MYFGVNGSDGSCCPNGIGAGASGTSGASVGAVVDKDVEDVAGAGCCDGAVVEVAVGGEGSCFACSDSSICWSCCSPCDADVCISDCLRAKASKCDTVGEAARAAIGGGEIIAALMGVGVAEVD